MLTGGEKESPAPGTKKKEATTVGVEPTTLGFLVIEDQSAKPLHHAAS